VPDPRLKSHREGKTAPEPKSKLAPALIPYPGFVLVIALHCVPSPADGLAGPEPVGLPTNTLLTNLGTPEAQRADGILLGPKLNLSHHKTTGRGFVLLFVGSFERKLPCGFRRPGSHL
jgi:hypothetical protein